MFETVKFSFLQSTWKIFFWKKLYVPHFWGEKDEKWDDHSEKPFSVRGKGKNSWSSLKCFTNVDIQPSLSQNDTKEQKIRVMYLNIDKKKLYLVMQNISINIIIQRK